jgi:Uma2 family endonuclease
MKEEVNKDMEVNEAITDYGQLDLNRLYTYLDYMKWRFQERVELIRGKVSKMSPGPNVTHQVTSAELSKILLVHFHKQPCLVFMAPFDVRLPVPSAAKDSTVVQPDICIICDENKLDEQGCNGAPDLVVEILSPGNSRHEKETKFQLYEESGVREYWIVDPNNKEIIVFTLVDGKYKQQPAFREGMILQSPLFPELKAAVDDVFERVKP